MGIVDYSVGRCRTLDDTLVTAAEKLERRLSFIMRSGLSRWHGLLFGRKDHENQKDLERKWKLVVLSSGSSYCCAFALAVIHSVSAISLLYFP